MIRVKLLIWLIKTINLIIQIWNYLRIRYISVSSIHRDEFWIDEANSEVQK